MINKIPILEIKNLKASINNIEILKGLNLTINEGEIHAIMGPNGSGKKYFFEGYCWTSCLSSFRWRDFV